MSDYETIYAQVLNARGVMRNPCKACNGLGVQLYSNGATWSGGIGGAMMTHGECNKCWGSGDKLNPWLNLKNLDKVLTEDQKHQLYEMSKKGTPK